VVGFQPPSDTNGASPAKRARLEAGSVNAGGGEQGWWPIVRFDASGQELVLKPERWTAKSTAGEIVAGYEQVPLILAWAISIHKAQGSQYDWHVGTAPARPAVPPPLCAHPPAPPARPAPLFAPAARALLAALPPPPSPPPLSQHGSEREWEFRGGADIRCTVSCKIHRGPLRDRLPPFAREGCPRGGCVL
jgi:hypothetical protein